MEIPVLLWLESVNKGEYLTLEIVDPYFSLYPILFLQSENLDIRLSIIFLLRRWSIGSHSIYIHNYTLTCIETKICDTLRHTFAHYELIWYSLKTN